VKNAIALGVYVAKDANFRGTSSIEIADRNEQGVDWEGKGLEKKKTKTTGQPGTVE